jgi:hypothetical protein
LGIVLINCRFCNTWQATMLGISDIVYECKELISIWNMVRRNLIDQTGCIYRTLSPRECCLNQNYFITLIKTIPTMLVLNCTYKFTLTLIFFKWPPQLIWILILTNVIYRFPFPNHNYKINRIDLFSTNVMFVCLCLSWVGAEASLTSSNLTKTH